jgi:hypothetical protein
MMQLFVKEFDATLYAIMVVFVKILVTVIGAIVLTVILEATAQKKLMNAIRRLVKTELHAEI